VKKQASYKRIRNAVERFLETFKNQKARDFKPQDLIDWQEALLEGGYEPATVAQDRQWVTKMVNRAEVNDEIYPKIPKIFRTTKRVFRTGENARDKVLSVEEYLRLLEASPEHLRDILTVQMYTGMRSEEPFKLRWEFIELKEGFIRIPAKLNKRAPARNVPMTGPVRTIIEKLPRGLPGTPVFRYRGKGIAKVTRSLKTACGAAGIAYGDNKDGFCFRDIRTTVQTNMENAGVGPKFVTYLTGRTQTGMDKFYFKPTEQDLRVQMDKYEAWLGVEVEKVKKSVKISKNGGLLAVSSD